MQHYVTFEDVKHEKFDGLIITGAPVEQMPFAARGELIATLDGDLQNDPADIPRLVAVLQARDLDLLQGWRQQRKDGWLLRKLPSRIANALIGRVTGVRLHDYGCSLKLYRSEVIKEVRLLGEMHRFIPVWVAGVTAPERIVETPVSHQARELGQSKYGLSRTFRVLLDLLAASFFLRYRARPGHFFGSIGLVLGALGALVMGYLGLHQGRQKTASYSATLRCNKHRVHPQEYRLYRG